jgi:hopanoid C-3 methylase
VLVGGHAAAAYPGPLEGGVIDGICLQDGEEVVPNLAEAIERRLALDTVPGLRLRTRDGWRTTPPAAEPAGLERLPLPARDLVDRHRSGYHCLIFKPVWLVETARGCPYRCTFCSVWQLHGHRFRERPVGPVVEDMAAAGEAVFVADDLFWHHPARSHELAEGLRRRGVRKRWLLVQTRTDLVARQAELLEAWRPLAKDFDIFFGFEAVSDAGLARVDKDAGVSACVEAIRIARSMGYGVNGNFLVDPDWAEEDFEALWDFVAHHGLRRTGYTILTPLPGTEYFERLAPRLAGQPWFRYDMHHLLWEPRLGARRFFELYAETWRRSVLNTSGDKRWMAWMRQVRLGQIPYISQALWRTQRMMRPDAYLREHGATVAGTASPAATGSS